MIPAWHDFLIQHALKMISKSNLANSSNIIHLRREREMCLTFDRLARRVVLVKVECSFQDIVTAGVKTSSETVKSSKIVIGKNCKENIVHKFELQMNRKLNIETQNSK